MTKDSVVIGIEEKTDRLGYRPNSFYPVNAHKLRTYSNTSDWLTSSEVFKKSLEERKHIYGVPANLGVYRLLNDEPEFHLLSKEGNLLLSPQFRDSLYWRLRSYGSERLLSESQNPKKLLLDAEEVKYVLSAIESGNAFNSRYSNLRFNDNSIEVRKDNTPEEKRLFLGAFGTKKPQKGSSITLISEEQVRQGLSDNKQGLLAMACYVNTQNDFTKFLTNTNRPCGFLAANNDFVNWMWVPG
jgi:hypothetical protein